MKAAVLYGNEDIRYEEYSTPAVKAGTVRIRIKAAGICGSDIPRVLHNGVHFYPIVLGHEFSGVIDAIGVGVKGFSIGDCVSGAPLIPCHQCRDCQNGNFSLCSHYSFVGSREQGAFADYVVLPAQNVVKYDPSVPFIHAAMFEPATVGLHGLLLSDYRGGENVAIIGGGTIGLFTMQWAKIFGAKKVVVFDVVPERLSLARELGADDTVNSVTEDMSERIAHITDGQGFDRVFETAGNPTTTKNAIAVAGKRATICYIGTPHGAVAFTSSEWEQINRKELRMFGSWMSYSAPYPGKEWELTAHYFGTGQLRANGAMIDRVFPMSQAGEAFALYREPGRVKGKIMLVND